MAGIAGIIRVAGFQAIERDLHLRDLNLMVDSMRHEPHYSGGIYVDHQIGVYVGWMGHSGSFSSCAPVVSSDGGVVLIFQGEEYRDGVTVHPNASYILDLYLRHGETMLRDLNGWYCGIIIDRRTARVTLFNDRFGIGRVYYAQRPEEFLFASEAKCLLRIQPALRRINPVAMAEYLRFECVTGEKSLFEGVGLLPNAAAWAFDVGSSAPKRRCYFNFEEWEAQPRLRADEIHSRFVETVSRVFPRYAVGGDPVGLSLTSGLDTRTIVAAIDPREKTVPCYTFGGAWGELLDIRVGRRIASMYRQPFEAINIDERFLQAFPEFAERTIYISDGTHDAFGAHDLYFNGRARQIAPIRLTGKFGSEIVRTRKLMPSLTYEAGVLNGDFRTSVFERLPAFSELSRESHPLTRVVAQEIPWHEFGRLAIEQSQVTLRTPYMDNDLVRLMYQVPVATRAAGDLQELYVRDSSPELSRIPTSMGRFISGNSILTRLLYLTFRTLLKIEYVYLFATPHWLTRIDSNLERLHLERMLTGRQKWEGYRIWSRTAFGDYLRDMLLRPGVHYGAVFDPVIVERLVDRHLAGTHNYMNSINRVLTVELIYRTLLGP
jgi:asparagine synthase (glutamine-hydrolysing)